MTGSTDITAVAEAYAAVWESRELDAIMSLHTEDTVFCLHLMGSVDIAGRDAVRGMFAGLLQLWPDIRFDTRRLTLGDGFFVNQYVLTATLAAPLPFGKLLAQPTGEPVSLGGVDVITVVGGLVHRKDTYLDIAAGQQQLGVLDQPLTVAR